MAIDDAGRDALDRIEFFSENRSAIVDGVSERINHAAYQRLSHRNLHDAAGALYQIAFFDFLKVAEQNGADFIFLEIERQPAYFVGKLEQLAGHNFLEAVNLGNAVADFNYRADFRDGDAGLKILDLLPNDFVDFVCFDWFHKFISDCQLPI